LADKKTKIELESPVLNEFLISITKESSRNEHRIRLISFEKFVKEKYKTLVNNNFVLNRLVGERKKAIGKKIYVYSFLAEYCEYLKHLNPTISRKRVELCLHTIRQCLNLATDGLINNDVYKLKVKNLPNKEKNMKTRLDYEDVVNIILTINNDLRLRTMVMLLAGSGLRVMEAIRTKYKYIQWDTKPPVINLPAEVSKTGVERNIILTGEMLKMLKEWIAYKYRFRKIVRKNDDGKISVDEYVKPNDIDESYIFKVRSDKTMDNYKFIYKEFQAAFKDVVEKTQLGKKFGNGRNSVTLHSLRWFTQTTIERATKRDVVSYFWIGKEQKNYQWEPDSKEELIELYNLVEPHLTFIDSKIINQNQQKQLDYLNQKIELQTQLLREQKKETLLLKFEPIINTLQEERIKSKQYSNISPQEQLEYFISSPKGKMTKPEDLELLKEMVEKSEIREVKLISPDEHEEGIEAISPSQYEINEIVDRLVKSGEVDKRFAERMKNGEFGTFLKVKAIPKE
jgi:integrase